MRAFSIALLFTTSVVSVFGQKFGAAENLGPAIPTPEILVQKMLEAAHVKAGETVYDLGSGDGRVVIMAAQKFGAHAVGIEIQPDLCIKARQRVQSLGLEDRVKIVEDSALRVDLSPANVVTMCFLTNSNDRLKPTLETHLKPGSRVVSNEFPIRGWKPAETVRVKVGKMDHAIYVYEIGRLR